MRILVFGDSIAYGAWDSEGGWVERLKKDAHNITLGSEGSNKKQVINLGIGGDTSTKILSRMESEIVARHSKSWPFVFVISVGTNDERMIDGVVETTLEEFDSNIKQIIEIAKKHTDKIVFVGSAPLGQKVLNFKGQEYSDERIREYETITKEIVNEHGIDFVEIRNSFEQADEELYSYDRLHPNDEGHELIKQLVEKKLEELKIL